MKDLFKSVKTHLFAMLTSELRCIVKNSLSFFTKLEKHHCVSFKLSDWLHVLWQIGEKKV